MTSYDPTESLSVIRRGVVAAKAARLPKPVREAVANFADLDSWLVAGGRQPSQWRTKRRGRPPLTEDGYINPDLTHKQHGTPYGYNHACRCIPCRAANRGEDPSVILELKRERGWA